MRSKGFSLLEIMAAITILAMVMALVWSTTSQNLNLKDKVEERDRVAQIAGITMDKIVTDLGQAFLMAPTFFGKAPNAEEGDANAQAGTRFIGESGGERDRVDFCTMSHRRYIKDSKESSYSEVGYSVEPDPLEPENLRLVRRESVVVDNEAKEGGEKMTLSEWVKSFELMYYNDKTDKWEDTWDSQGNVNQGQLPKAVRIKLEVIDPSIEEGVMTFMTIGTIQLWDSPVTF